MGTCAVLPSRWSESQPGAASSEEPADSSRAQQNAAYWRAANDRRPDSADRHASDRELESAAGRRPATDGETIILGRNYIIATRSRKVPSGTAMNRGDLQPLVLAPTPGIVSRHRSLRFRPKDLCAKTGPNWAKLPETQRRVEVVAVTHDKDNAIDWQLADQSRWTLPRSVPAIAAYPV